MTTTDTATDRRSPITDEQVAAINAAREALQQIASDATSQAWNAPSDSTSDGPRAQSLGRLAGAASMAADNLFDVLNVANAYGVANMSDAQLQNRQGDEGQS